MSFQNSCGEFMSPVPQNSILLTNGVFAACQILLKSCLYVFEAPEIISLQIGNSTMQGLPLMALNIKFLREEIKVTKNYLMMCSTSIEIREVKFKLLYNNSLS